MYFRSTLGSEVCVQRGTVIRRADIRVCARDGYFQHQFTIHGQLRMNCVKVTPVHDREGAQRSFCPWLGSSATTQVGITCPDLKLTPGPRSLYFKLIPQVLFTYGPTALGYCLSQHLSGFRISQTSKITNEFFVLMKSCPSVILQRATKRDGRQLSPSLIS